jgi:hypothetical protein
MTNAITTDGQAAVFTARDSHQREHLLRMIGWALEAEGTVDYVSRRAFEGEGTSVYLYSFYELGWSGGQEHGIEYAYDRFHGRKASDIAARVGARSKRRKKVKRR